MPLWPFGRKIRRRPVGPVDEIARLQQFVAEKDKERGGIIRDVRGIEAEIRVKQSDMQREASRAVREIMQDQLTELLDKLDVLQAKATRISQAVKAPAQLIATYEGMAVDRQAAVTAEQIDRAIAESEAMIAERREANDALEELRRFEAAEAASRRAERRPVGLSEATPQSTVEPPAQMPEVLRQRLRSAGLLEDASV